MERPSYGINEVTRALSRHTDEDGMSVVYWHLRLDVICTYIQFISIFVKYSKPLVTNICKSQNANKKPQCTPRQRVSYNYNWIVYWIRLAKIALNFRPVHRTQAVKRVFTARAYARAVLGVVILSVCLSVCLSVRPSVCPSVTRVHCDKTK